MNQKFVSYIDEHICEDITLESIASHFGYSKFYFSRMIKKHMNVTVMEYVQKRRLTLSVEQILQGRRILDIAYDFGWQSNSSFAKAFKKEFGVSPSYVKTMGFVISDLGGIAMVNGQIRTTGMETKEELVEILIRIMNTNGLKFNEKRFRGFVEKAADTYRGMKRYSGEDYITHPLNAAIILAQAEAELNTIIAGLFCDVRRKGIELEEEGLPDKVLDILEDLDQISKDTISDEALLVAAAERLHNMRTIEYMPEERRTEKVKETLESFLPLARRLPNNALINEINSLCIDNIESTRNI